MAGPYLGGSFAPPLDKEKLASYRKLAEGAPADVKDAMLQLCDMLALFWQTPRSRLAAQPHPFGLPVTITPLEEEEVNRVWDAVPWRDELDAYAARFERISPETHKALRDAAFHLLWYGYELFLDREPVTSDQLQG